MNTKEKIEVMQAFEDGKLIEFSNGDGDWKHVGEPSWDWACFEYRIKKAPSYYTTTMVPSFAADPIKVVETKALEDALGLIQKYSVCRPMRDKTDIETIEALRELVK